MVLRNSEEPIVAPHTMKASGLETSQKRSLEKSNFDVPAVFYQIGRQYRHKVFHGGRGSAKSRSVGAYLIGAADKEKLRILCCREIQKSIGASVKQILEDEIERQGLEDRYDVTQYKIKNLVTGSVFLFAGLRSNPESIKSMEGLDIVWIEEAQTVSQTSIDLLVPTLRKDNSTLIWTFNPRFEDDPVYKMFMDEGGPPPNSLVVQVNYVDNPYFPSVLRDTMEWDKRRDYDRYMHIWMGQCVQRSDAKVFKNWDIDDLDAETAELTPHYGADWGFSIDPTVLLRCVVIPKKRIVYFSHEAYQVGCKIADTPKLFDQVPDSRRYAIRADSARPETIAHMKDNGFPLMVGARKGPGSVNEGVEFLKSWDIVVHPRCGNLITELGLYSYKIDKLTDAVLPELADKDNHLIDAARYALEEVRRQNRLPGFGDVGKGLGGGSVILGTNRDGVIGADVKPGSLNHGAQEFKTGPEEIANFGPKGGASAEKLTKNHPYF